MANRSRNISAGVSELAMSTFVERRSPYRHAEERRKVVLVLRIFYHTASKLQFFYLPDANLNSLFPIFNSFFLSLRAIMRNDNNYNK